MSWGFGLGIHCPRLPFKKPSLAQGWARGQQRMDGVQEAGAKMDGKEDGGSAPCVKVSRSHPPTHTHTLNYSRAVNDNN